MQERISIIVTSISEPNTALRNLAEGCKAHGYEFLVVGDASSPADFHISHCDFYSLAQQEKAGLKFVRLCPKQHYARKNIGYLVAIQNGADIIVDTDDDNVPYKAFWSVRKRTHQVPTVERTGWLNAYRYFSDEHIWPRGLPLNKIISDDLPFESLPIRTVDCPIQQGLANENPDVDAVFRLVLPLPQNFRSDRRIALASGVWSPFNSQNTTWWKDAFPLLYLPAYCSFRMTDIFRSFVAQRIAWENDWAVLFHEPTVWQQRNEHDLMKDFADEVPGYLHNERICEELGRLSIKGGVGNLTHNLQISYEKLVEIGVIEKGELPLIEAWIEDLKAVGTFRAE